MNKSLITRLKRYAVLYIFILIPILYYFIFRYYPILTQFVLSFKKYTIKGGVWQSPWVGFANYLELFTSFDFSRLVRNTIVISLLRIVVGFLPPIILSILLFDMSSNTYRRLSQSILYIPHFFSWVVMYAIVTALFSPTGYMNSLISRFGGVKQDFLTDTKWTYTLLIGSDIWKNLGWSTIIYLAALTNVDPQLFDAAKVDGAGPLRRIYNITLPSIMSVIIFVLTISLGNLLNNTGTEQILLFYSPATYSVADVIGTWVFRRGLGEMKYSLASAISQINSVIGLILVLVFNKIASKVADVSIW